jgi:hypothetical protein
MRSAAAIGAGVLLLTALIAPTTMAAAPNSGSATVDGATGDWSLGADFFADMADAGRDDVPVRAKLYLKYDCETETLFALVLSEGDEKVRQDRPDEAYIAIDGEKVIEEGESFAWVNGDGTLADGFEGSAELEPGSYTLRAHVLVADDSADGYTPMDVIGRTTSLDIECEEDEEPTDEEPTDEEPTDEEPTDEEPTNPGGGVGPTTGTRPQRTLPPTDTIEAVTAPSNGVGMVLAILGVGSLATLALTFGRRRQPVAIKVEETTKH